METSLRERSLPQTGRLRSTVWSTRKHIREKQLLRNKRSSRGEQDRKKKQEIIWLKKKSCKMTDEYSCAATPQIRQTGNRLSGLAETAYASLLAQCFV